MFNKMKTKAYVFLVVVFCVGLALLYVNNVSSTAPEKELTQVSPSGPVSRPSSKKEVKKLSSAEREDLAQTDSDNYFNFERSIKDRDYGLKARKSSRILQYMNAPRRGDPEYEDVLHTLLRNGFGIEDWIPTIVNIKEWSLPFKIRQENLEQLGYSQEEIEENLRDMYEMRKGDVDMIKEAIRHDVGILDESVLDELMAIPIVMENREAPFGRGSYDLFEGDSLHTDDDWMTPAHKASLASYEGPPVERLTELERISWYREWKAKQLGVDPEKVTRLSRNYVGFGSPPADWKPGQSLKRTP